MTDQEKESTAPPMSRAASSGQPRAPSVWSSILLFAVPVPLLAAAGLAVYAIAAVALESDLATFRHGAGGFFDYLSRLPYFSGLSVAAAVLAAYLTFRLWRSSSYRLRALLAGGVALFGAVIMAFAFHFLGLDVTVRQTPALVLPPEAFVAKKQQSWTQPDGGLLGGTVIGSDDFGIVVRTFDGKTWYVEAAKGTPGLDYAQFMMQVRVIGKPDGVDTFQAQEIRPWEYQKAPAVGGQ